MTSSSKRNNIAAWLLEPQGTLSTSSTLVNVPEAGEILIENHALAIQPLDAKIHNAGYGGSGSAGQYPKILGTNLAGVVIAVGDGVETVQVGDHVVADTAAYTKGDPKMGAWQQYVIADSRTVAKIGSAEFARAVLLGFPLQTAVAALQVHLGMGKPGTGSPEEKVLIWGAGGAVGTCAVQYAKSVGHTVIVTASPRDISRQKAIGAIEIVDYKAANVVDRLRKLGPYKYVFNATGDPTSHTAISEIIQPEGGTYASVLPAQSSLENVKVIYTTFSMTAQKEEYDNFRKWWYGDYLPQAIVEGKIDPPRFVKKEGGLKMLQQASKDVFEGKIREKVVIDPSEG